MRSCGVWNANSNCAVFAWTGPTTIGWRANPSRQSVRDEKAGHQARLIESSFSRGASHATSFNHCIRSYFLSARGSQRSVDVSWSILGWAAQEIPAGRSLHAWSRAEMAGKACSRSRICRKHRRSRSAGAYCVTRIRADSCPLRRALSINLCRV
jgi:hypothetical protein